MFLTALEKLSRERGRDGAYAWGVFEDAEEAGRGSSSWQTPGWSTFASMSASPMPIAFCRIWFLDFIE